MNSRVELQDAETGSELSGKIISLANNQRFFKMHFTPEALYSIFQRMLSSQLISFSSRLKKSTNLQIYFVEEYYLNYEQNILIDRNEFFFPNFVSEYFQDFYLLAKFSRKIFFSHLFQKMEKLPQT